MPHHPSSQHRSSGEAPLSTPLERNQLDRIQTRAGAALEDAADRLTGICGTATSLEITDVRYEPLAHFAEARPGGGGDPADPIAGVMLRFEGAASGSALLALDPEDAFAWLALGGASEDPLGTFVAWAEALVGPLLASLALEPGEGRLEERSLVGALVATRAPSDTGVVSLDLEIHCGLLKAPAGLHLLVEPKPLGCWIATLLGDGARD